MKRNDQLLLAYTVFSTIDCCAHKNGNIHKINIRQFLMPDIYFLWVAVLSVCTVDRTSTGKSCSTSQFFLSVCVDGSHRRWFCFLIVFICTNTANERESQICKRWKFQNKEYLHNWKIAAFPKTLAYFKHVIFSFLYESIPSPAMVFVFFLVFLVFVAKISPSSADS